MNILHTSDWHLGRSLYGHKRYAEFSAFLDWLLMIVEQEQIELLLISGDIFDSSTPSNQAQQLYYQFLCQITLSCCKNVVIIAGNHDSPSFLSAPKQLLQALNIHIVAAISDNFSDEVITISNNKKEPQLIICAVPYLRDRDVRTVDVGESIEEKHLKLSNGVSAYYHEIGQFAKQRQNELKQITQKEIPIIAMGHLFTAGGQTIEGDGVRELYVGSLAHIDPDCFNNYFDYVALGHLHLPQIVAKNERICYSGSPIAMGFGEATQVKNIVLLQIETQIETQIKTQIKISRYPIPSFQKLEQIKGNLTTILQRIAQLKQENNHIWLEIDYQGTEHISNLREQIYDASHPSKLTIVKIKNSELRNRITMNTAQHNETLDELTNEEVFMRCLNSHEIPAEQLPELLNCYQQVLTQLNETKEDLLIFKEKDKEFIQ